MEKTSSAAVFSALFLLLGLASACKREASAPATLRIAAASDAIAAFETLGKIFETRHQTKVSFTFGSSGLLAKQLVEGAPFDVFVSASAAYAADVIDSGACDRETRAVYGRGQLALWSRRDSRQTPPASLAELTEARFTRLAIANPDHAPYGVAAREALRRTGIWERVEPKLVYGENVRQALQLAESGNVEAAIVALPLVAEDETGTWTLIEASLHAPIEQVLVVCKNGTNAQDGRRFAELVTSGEGRAVLKRFGFLPPAGEPQAAP